MSSESKGGALGCLGLIVLVVGVGICGAAKSAHRVEHTACTVEDKDRAGNSNGGSDMRLYTSCGTFSVKDSVWLARWDSADLYSQIDVGETYDIQTSGWRFGFLSWFPNVVTVEVSDA